MARDAPRAERESFEREALPLLDFVYRIAMRFAGDPARAEDLVQETMFRAMRSWGRFQPGTNVRAWLATILRNVFIAEYRRERRRGRPVPLAVLDYSGASPDTETDPESDFFDRLVDDEVTGAIDALPLAYREPLVLSDVEDLKYTEIAAIMGLPLGTVKSRIFRARRILRRRLRNYAVESGYVSAGGDGQRVTIDRSPDGRFSPAGAPQPPQEVVRVLDR